MRLSPNSPELNGLERDCVDRLLAAAQMLIEFRGKWAGERLKQPVTIEIFTTDGECKSLTLIREQEQPI